MYYNSLEMSDYLAGSAVIISIFTFLISFNQNKKGLKVQIQTDKLEELLQLIIELSRYYVIFKSLYLKVNVLRDQSNVELSTISEYKKIRDIKLPIDKQLQIDKILSRIEVLYLSYTEKHLKNKIESYYKMMEIFYVYILNTGDLRKERHYKNGFPDFDEIDLLLNEIIELLTNEIKVYT